MHSTTFFDSTRRLRSLVSRWVFFGLLWSGSAAAQGAGTTQAPDPTTEARVLYLKGNAVFKAGDDILAREYYKRSLAQRESFDTYCNLGLAEEAGALYKDSYFHLGLCLKFYPEAEELSGPRHKYALLRDEVGARLSPEDMVTLDHQVQGHVMNPVAAPVPPPVETQPEPAPVEKPVEKPPAPATYSTARLPVVLSMGVVGAAGVGIGVGYLVDSMTKRNDASDLRDELNADNESCDQGEDNDSRCEDLSSLSDKADRNNTIGIALTASGGALAVASVLLYVLWPEQKQSSTSLGSAGHATWSVRPDVQLLSSKGQFLWGVRGQF